jgi:hypothetical protein
MSMIFPGMDPAIVLDIQAELAHTSEARGYAERLKYAVPCVPLLAPADQTWADALIRQGSGLQEYPHQEKVSRSTQ